MSQTKKEKPELRDRFERPLKVDDCVAVSHANRLLIAKIIKVNPKMISIVEIDKKPSPWGPTIYNKYPHECVLVEGQYLTFYMIKHL